MSERPTVVWENLNFDGFAALARDDRLSKYEKIGFPDSYRAGYEQAIFSDICAKVHRIQGRDLRILDIGPGCSDVAAMMIEFCREHGHRLTVIDSEPMLALLPHESFIDRRVGLFPKNRAMLTDLVGAVDVIVMYSVFHYIFVDANPFDAVDLCVELLAPGGQAIIGDIPNLSMRNRFFSSPAGIAFHHAFSGQTTEPPPMIDGPGWGRIDDTVITALLGRVRASGVNAYVMPQAPDLPMQNRREDIVLCKP